jgi:5-methylcytosine-specific restriction enzyme subunit McrC
MNTLFERYVTRRLQDASPDITVEAQPKSKLDETGKVDINPDIVFHRDGRPVAVVDTKYKLLEAGTGRSSDYYQALAYATAYGLNEVWLIYARTPGEEPAGTIRVRNSPVTIRTVGLDLNVPIVQLDQQITSLAELISDKPGPTEAPTGQLIGAG